MTLIRVEHDKENPYVIVNKSIVMDERLSLKAKAIYFYAFSRPDDWTFYAKEIIKHCKDGQTAVDAGLKELEKNGYLVRIRVRNEKGHLGEAEWVFYETPQKICLKCQNPVLVNSSLDNRKLLNKEDKQIKINTKFCSCPADAGAQNASGVFVSSEVASDQSQIDQGAKEARQERKEPPRRESHAKVNKVDQTALYCKITAERCDWSAPEITEAIEIIEAKTEKVNDIFEFMKGTIENLRKRKRSKEKKVANKSKKGYSRTFKEKEEPYDGEVISMEELWEREKKEKDELLRSKRGKAEKKK